VIDTIIEIVKEHLNANANALNMPELRKDLAETLKKRYPLTRYYIRKRRI